MKILKKMKLFVEALGLNPDLVFDDGYKIYYQEKYWSLHTFVEFKNRCNDIFIANLECEEFTYKNFIASVNFLDFKTRELKNEIN